MSALILSRVPREERRPACDETHEKMEKRPDSSDTHAVRLAAYLACSWGKGSGRERITYGGRDQDLATHHITFQTRGEARHGTAKDRPCSHSKRMGAGGEQERFEAIAGKSQQSEARKDSREAIVGTVLTTEFREYSQFHRTSLNMATLLVFGINKAQVALRIFGIITTSGRIFARSSASVFFRSSPLSSHPPSTSSPASSSSSSSSSSNPSQQVYKVVLIRVPAAIPGGQSDNPT
ncbi:hypothetical protein EYF80_017203 [Liparis tanakae]|uniref:Uncharacterized protein n=1 Tax=Liparis tanakae TaxID=230148 RepID=A0A4Z2I3E4_9TELE|nr:hypothetical protein EYF80_017203 [Liparis tanakae]